MADPSRPSPGILEVVAHIGRRWAVDFPHVETLPDAASIINAGRLLAGLLRDVEAEKRWIRNVRFDDESPIAALREGDFAKFEQMVMEVCGL